MVHLPRYTMKHKVHFEIMNLNLQEDFILMNYAFSKINSFSSFLSVVWFSLLYYNNCISSPVINKKDMQQEGQETSLDG